jgi:hypothetical protein
MVLATRLRSVRGCACQHWALQSPFLYFNDPPYSQVLLLVGARGSSCAQLSKGFALSRVLLYCGSLVLLGRCAVSMSQ